MTNSLLSRAITAQWAVMKPHAERASSLEDSSRDAVGYAKEHAPEGDIKAKGLNGKFHRVQKGNG